LLLLRVMRMLSAKEAWEVVVRVRRNWVCGVCAEEGGKGAHSPAFATATLTGAKGGEEVGISVLLRRIVATGDPPMAVTAATVRRGLVGGWRGPGLEVVEVGPPTTLLLLLLTLLPLILLTLLLVSKECLPAALLLLDLCVSEASGERLGDRRPSAAEGAWRLCCCCWWWSSAEPTEGAREENIG
jgi:hypothetical protein